MQCIYFVIFGTLAVMSGCKPKEIADTSKVKTLDSIASGVLNIDAYQCRGSRTASISDSSIVFDKKDVQKIDDAKKSEIRRAVKDYFSALPSSAEALFLKLGGQVVISSRASDLCQSAHFGKSLDASQGEVTDGCFNYVSDPSGKSLPVFTIVQSPDPKKIRYYGPQIFGYLYAQFYSRLALAKGGKSIEITDKEPMSFVGRKEHIANSFLSDLLAMKSYKFEALKNILGQNVESELRSSDTLEPIDRLTALRDGGRRAQFLDYVYANSFQSAHCNQTSLDVARQKFKLSSELFADIDSAVVDISNLLMGVSSSAQGSTGSSAKGFALAGGDLLSSVMPLFGSLQSMLGGAGAGGAGAGGISSLFSSLLSGGGGGLGSVLSSMGGLSKLQESFGGLFSQLTSAGAVSSNGGGCSGGSCSGGSCSSCSNGSCGGACGSCSTSPG